MLGSAYRWLLLQPLFRGSLLSLAVAGFCVGTLFIIPVASPTSCTAVIAVAPNPTPAVNNRNEWPATVIRLWFLVPLLLPYES
jgi:hypothetical protein